MSNRPFHKRVDMGRNVCIGLFGVLFLLCPFNMLELYADNDLMVIYDVNGNKIHVSLSQRSNKALTQGARISENRISNTENIPPKKDFGEPDFVAERLARESAELADKQVYRNAENIIQELTGSRVTVEVFPNPSYNPHTSIQAKEPTWGVTSVRGDFSTNSAVTTSSRVTSTAYIYDVNGNRVPLAPSSSQVVQNNRALVRGKITGETLVPFDYHKNDLDKRQDEALVHDKRQGQSHAERELANLAEHEHTLSSVPAVVPSVVAPMSRSADSMRGALSHSSISTEGPQGLLMREGTRLPSFFIEGGRATSSNRSMRSSFDSAPLASIQTRDVLERAEQRKELPSHRHEDEHNHAHAHIFEMYTVDELLSNVNAQMTEPIRINMDFVAEESAFILRVQNPNDTIMPAIRPEIAEAMIILRKIDETTRNLTLLEPEQSNKVLNFLTIPEAYTEYKAVLADDVEQVASEERMLVQIPLPHMPSQEEILRVSVDKTYPLMQEVSITGTMRAALDFSPSLRSLQAAGAGTYYEIKEIRAGYFPKAYINASIGYGMLDTTTTRAAGTSNDLAPSGYAAFEIRQLLWHGGRIRYAIQEQEYKLKALEQMFYDTSSAIALEGLIAHVEVLRTEELYYITEDFVRRHADLLESERELFAAGISSETDVKQAESSFAAAQAEFITTKQAYNIACINYSKLTGLPSPKGEDYALFLEEPHLPYLAMDRTEVEITRDSILESEEFLESGRTQSLSHMEARALLRNPRILAAEAEYKASGKSLSATKAEALPEITLFTNVSYFDNTIGESPFASQYNSYFATESGRQTQASIGIGFKWKIFDGLATRNATRAAHKTINVTHKNLEDIRNTVKNEVTNTYENILAARRVQNSHRVTLEENRQTRDQYLEEFTFGTRSLREVLDAEAILYATQVDLAMARSIELVHAWRLTALQGDLLESIGISRPLRISDINL